MSPKQLGDMMETDPELRLSDEGKRSARNCESDSNPSFHLEWAPELRQCPKAFLTEEIWGAVRWWVDWREYQILPYEGDMASQPAFVSQAISVCQQEARTIEAEQMRKARESQPGNPDLPPEQTFGAG